MPNLPFTEHQLSGTPLLPTFFHEDIDLRYASRESTVFISPIKKDFEGHEQTFRIDETVTKQWREKKFMLKRKTITICLPKLNHFNETKQVSWKEK